MNQKRSSTSTATSTGLGENPWMLLEWQSIFVACVVVVMELPKLWVYWGTDMPQSTASVRAYGLQQEKTAWPLMVLHIISGSTVALLSVRAIVCAVLRAKRDHALRFHLYQFDLDEVDRRDGWGWLFLLAHRVFAFTVLCQCYKLGPAPVWLAIPINLALLYKLHQAQAENTADQYLLWLRAPTAFTALAPILNAWLGL